MYNMKEAIEEVAHAVNSSEASFSQVNEVSVVQLALLSQIVNQLWVLNDILDDVATHYNIERK